MRQRFARFIADLAARPQTVARCPDCQLCGGEHGPKCPNDPDLAEHEARQHTARMHVFLGQGTGEARGITC